MKLILLVNDRLEMILPRFLDITRSYTSFTSTVSLETERSGSIEAYLFIDLFTSHKLVSGPSWPLSKTPPTPPNQTPYTPDYIRSHVCPLPHKIWHWHWYLIHSCLRPGRALLCLQIFNPSKGISTWSYFLLLPMFEKYRQLLYIWLMTVTIC